MKSMMGNLLSFAARHLPDLLSAFCAIIFFLVVSGYFISEKGAFEKLFATGAGFFGGMVGGGILGWIVGGFGVVAMGTGVGVGAVGAIILGGIFGAVLGGLTGATFSFVQMIRNPSDYNVNWLALLLVLFGATIVFLALRWLFKKMPTMLNRNPSSTPH
ncbi:hypothetical protein LCM27_06625 [Ruegeria marisrubri]|uniref:hypothetical protein n=1 Tax=Ruegeria marisrubri TaxID=1685379 RepID=UPI001CD2AB76|nr:hypothetical protein [Ruegeria marisrubri]MCA0906069.1 hypothetical protein [Ruegeria marisrubri]